MEHRPLEDWEFPEPDEQGDSVETLRCPSCRDEVYEEAEWCPTCGQYVVFDNRPLSGREWWFVSLGLLGMAAVILALSMVP